jgi:hypothetical protein
MMELLTTACEGMFTMAVPYAAMTGLYGRYFAFHGQHWLRINSYEMLKC